MNNSPLSVRALLPALMLGTLAASTAAPGDPDTSFNGTGGSVQSLSPDEDTAWALALQPDGKILAAGDTAGDDFALLRLNPNGSIDNTFGTGGTGKIIHSFGLFESARGIAVQSDGKIIVGGAGLPGGGSRDFAVARCLANGTLDPAFNSGAVLTTDINGGFNDQVWAMAVQTDGKIILAGSHRTNLAMVRYLSTGALDPNFGTGGKVFTAASTATEQQINALTVMADGRIVAAGQSRTGSNTDVLVARFLANGTPDATFAGTGKATAPLGAGNVSDIANAVAVQPDGKVVVVGTTGDDFLLMRFTTGGILDNTFAGGAGAIPLGFTNGTEIGTGVIVQADGNIIVTGSTRISGRDYFAAMRLVPAGNALDPAFGAGGGFATGISTGSDTARTALLQPDGKLLLAGAAGNPAATRDFGVARFETTAPLTLATWRQQHFGTTANTGDAANDADPDKDGLVNLLEYAFGQNPKQTASRTLPPVQVTGGNLTTTFTAPSLTGITYAAEWSPTMTAGTWQNITDTGSGPVHTFNVPVAGKTKVYLRWRITPS